MNPVYDKLMTCFRCYQEKIDFTPEVALVLGSGLGDFAKDIEVKAELDYHDIDGFPVSTVPGHDGRYIFGYVHGVPVVCMKGRVHYYEGYSMEDVVLPIRLMKLMGAKVLFLTNAAGGLNTDFSAGDLMLITDQISSFVPSPLIGANMEELGTRFPDMSHIYDPDLATIIRHTALNLGQQLQEGVYIQLTGPNFESPAEVRMCQTLGADAVGINCSVGPEQLVSIVEGLNQRLHIPMIVKPNAGMPKISDTGEASYDMTPERFGRSMKVLLEKGAKIVGGCCGTTPDFIRELKKLA